MNNEFSSLEIKLKYLPDSPGVYIMKNAKGEVIYVGKALQLNKRVRSYFTGRETDGRLEEHPIIYSSIPPYSQVVYNAKVESMVSRIADLEYIVTTTEEEAFLLEANLIKKYKPKYNISLRDDKRYPFLKLTMNEPFPRLSVTRQIVQDGSRYFGPYADAAAIRKTLRYIEWILPIRTCARIINPIEDEDAPEKRRKPCLNYQLGKCPAPCIGAVSQEEYLKTIKNIISFLNGRDKEIIESLKEDMLKASEELQFEKAAKIRDRIGTLEQITRSQTIHFADEENRDVIAIYKEENLVAVSVLKILGGKLLNKENHRFDNAEDESVEDILSAFLSQYYAEKIDSLPTKVFLSHTPNDFEKLNKWLKNRLFVPKRGDNKMLMNIAHKNAFNFVETNKLSHLRKTSRTVFPVQELKEKLNLNKLPRKMVCIDVSTIGGIDTVSSLVYFENGKPSKKRYRRFIIKNSEIQDDYAAISETLTRYLTKIEDADIPDLIVIDGGKGQLNTANNAMKQIEIQRIPIISLAEKVEQVFTSDATEPIFLPRSSSALRLLVNIRDEAHRFAISFHRQRRKKRMLTSELDNIKGIGDNKKFLLLNSFGSIANIKKATIEELMMVKGIGKRTAELIKAELNKKEEDGLNNQ